MITAMSVPTASAADQVGGLQQSLIAAQADGSTPMLNSNGTYTVYNPDGSTTVMNPDGTIQPGAGMTPAQVTTAAITAATTPVTATATTLDPTSMLVIAAVGVFLLMERGK